MRCVESNPDGRPWSVLLTSCRMPKEASSWALTSWSSQLTSALTFPTLSQGSPDDGDKLAEVVLFRPEDELLTSFKRKPLVG